ncbi:hypothetical protein CB0940_01363 [Cercospora beticola]|uniref:Methyltransferase type 11 domain-containing protein n=1 Tax=Cercospora beticola TaxID=122368 RepID=A0A2G5I9I9_CERBT|nr:hypothetical protein CB0940_01363 [Cercospora beticola]PIB01461.1 hypothetical protein CB0940_01363 [Cercospora beticola]WPA96800.1 hypothetical protein RHO25_001408 [Cercospora beticola]CAK1354830.1 unnamed protein product [Cercospora beticola]
MVKLSDTKGGDWEEMAKVYKQLTVEISSRPIGVMLDKANALLPFSEATGIHDNGCGPGPVISRIIADYGSVLPKNCDLSASDFAEAMIAQVRQTKNEEIDKDPDSPWARVDVSLLDAMDLQGINDGSKSHVLAGWVYFMTPSPQKCLEESMRVLKSGGVLSCSSWQNSEWLQLMNLVQEIRPEAPVPEIPEGWRSAKGLLAEVEGAGFQQVEAVEVDVEMAFETHEALLEILTAKMPHMVKLLSSWSEGEVKRLRSLMSERLKKVCPEEPGKLSGVALVAVGRKA